MSKGLCGQLTFILCCIVVIFSISGQACSSSPEISPTPSLPASSPVSATPTAALTVAPTVQPPMPTAVSGSIEIISSETETDFPSSLTFRVEAESSYKIDSIKLRYKVKKISLAQVATEVEPEFDSDKHVETSWKWDTRKAPLPPGAEIQYQWLIEDSAKRKTQTSWTTLVFHDLRYDWNTLSDANVSLYWYTGSQSFGSQLMNAAQGGLDKLSDDTGAHLEKPVKIYIYGNTDELRDSLVYPSEWTGGVAFVEYGIVAIGIAPENLDWGKRAMVHELAHLVTYQMTNSPYGDIPTWLEEGLSMYAEGDLEERFQSVLTSAISGGTLISVQSLCSSFPADPAGAHLAYAESYSIVDFLIQTYGRDKMFELLNIFKEGSSYDDALMEVYSFNTNGLEADWLKYIGAN